MSAAQAVSLRRISIGDLVLHVLADNQDANWYGQRKTFEEMASPLYGWLADAGFESFVDVGANVGFVSILARRAAPTLRVIAIEADPRLAPVIKLNFARHGIDPSSVVHAVVGDRGQPDAAFSINPSSTLDNRVAVAAWSQVQVGMRTLDEILRAGRDPGRCFIKVDTQGFELQVLRGAAPYLDAHSDWVLKMEFAPEWLVSQGTDPMDVLEHLAGRCEVAEFPERIPFGTPGLEALFAHPLRRVDHARFVEHVRSLNKSGRGWVDLLVRPRAGARTD